MYINYSEKFQCVFLPIAKNASTSIQTWLYELDDLKYDAQLAVDGKRTLVISTQQFHERFSDYFLFTCVRNPYSRLLSCFLDKFVFSLFEDGVRKERVGASIEAYQQNINKFEKLERFAIDNLSVDYNQGMTFEIFLQAIEANWFPDPHRDRVDSHWASQYDLGHFEYISYNQICHCENILMDMNLVEEQLGIPDNKKFNVVKNKGRHLESLKDSSYYGNMTAAELSKSSSCTKVPEKNFYSLQTVNLVKEKFEKDLDSLNYDNLGYL